MALRGNLRDFSLPDVFQLVTLSGKTGVLRIKRSDAEGSVWFRDGAVFFAQSDWQREPLGTRLVAAGRLTPNALTRALDIQRGEPAGGRRLGGILVDEGYVSDKVLEAFVQEQIQDTIFDLFRWDEGDFDFEPLEVVPEEDIGLSVSIENVVMEGSRRLEEWTRIKKKIPSMEIVFKMATAPGEGTFDISLKPTEWNLLLKVDGTRSVAELAREMNRTDFEVARIIYGLFSAGLLEVASEDEVERLRAERAVTEAALAAEEPRDAPAAAAPSAPIAPETEAPEPAPAPMAPTEPVAMAAPGPEPVAPPVSHVVEEPAFLSAGTAPASTDDMAVFQEMMGAVLESPVAAPAPDAVAAPEPSVAAPDVTLVEPEEPALASQPPSSMYVFADEEPVVAPVVEVVPASALAGTPQALEDASAPAEAVAPVQPFDEGPGEAPVTGDDLSGLLETLGAAQPEAGVPPAGPGVMEPASVVGPDDAPFSEAPSPALSGDYAADLMALGLGEAPTQDLLEPMGVIPEERELTIAEMEEAVRAADSGELTIAQIEAAATAAAVPEKAAGAPDLTDLLNSLGGPEGETTAAVLDTSAVLPIGEDGGVLGDTDAGRSSGVISTDAFLADFGSSDVSFSSGLGDEITALTGGGSGRVRPSVSVAKIPESDAVGPILHRDSHVDKDLLLRIIDGVQKL
ncbi:MAG TPA: DUF4388 domain-containing protein [Coriobacteriia bacterium]